MSFIRNIILELWCLVYHKSHDSVFERNLYGDQINYWGARSLYKCKRCGTYERGLTLHKEDGV